MSLWMQESRTSTNESPDKRLETKYVHTNSLKVLRHCGGRESKHLSPHAVTVSRRLTAHYLQLHGALVCRQSVNKLHALVISAGRTSSTAAAETANEHRISIATYVSMYLAACQRSLLYLINDSSGGALK